MSDEVYSFALKNTLNQVQNICPDIKNSFMFREDGKIVARDENTSEETITRVVKAFEGVLEKADTIGGVECVTLEGSKGRVNISCINDLYLVTVTSRKADMNYVNTVTRVLVPTVLKLLEKIHPASLKSSSLVPEVEPKIEPQIPITEKFEEEPTEEIVEETVTEEPEESMEPEVIPEPSLPEPPVNQFIVENLGGLLIPSDTVRIDSEILSQWEELYQGRKIEKVEVETFDGKATECKVKPIKNSKYEGKGIIRIPEKMQLTLKIKKGELVRVRPIVE